MDTQENDLPEGWIKQFDEASERYFYVDTKADPPRSIWTHPYDDPIFLASIPDTQTAKQETYTPPPGPPPVRSRGSPSRSFIENETQRPYEDPQREIRQQEYREQYSRSPRRRSYSPDSDSSAERDYRSRQQPYPQQRYEQPYPPQQQQPYPPYPPQAYQQPYPQSQQQGYPYPPPYPPPQGYQQPYYGQPGQYPPPQTVIVREEVPVQRGGMMGGMGGMGMALPLLGGLAGGLLLDDLLF